MTLGKTDKAWEILFERHKILQNVHQNGFFEIQAKDIKKEREPRLMAKFDHFSQLPKIFKDNRISILPISRSRASTVAGWINWILKLAETY